MAASAGISVAEYLALKRPDRPEPDYVSGEIVERALPTHLHGKIQALLILLFGRLLQRLPIEIATEVRARITPELYRVIDVVVHLRPEQEQGHLTQPPDVAIEILSPDDTYRDLTRRLEDYRRWGIPHVWLVDPWAKRLHEYNDIGLMQRSSLRLEEQDFEITAAELFANI